jgi:hypothetical protein
MHLQSVIDKAGHGDVSFNAIGLPNTTVQGVPLVIWQSSSFPSRLRPTRGPTF